MSEIALSVSRIKSGLDCLRRYYYQYLAKNRIRRTDYPRLCGIVTHRLIEQGHKRKGVAQPVPFRLASRGKTIGLWFVLWEHYLKEVMANGMLEERRPHLEARFRRIGLICAGRYFAGAAKLPPPLEVESWYEHEIAPGIRLTCRIDQLRAVSLDYIRRHRPELVADGRLIDGYDPVVIVDFKTGERDYSYSRRRFHIEPTLRERMRRQFDLMEDLQATTCTFLYHKTKGRKPVGFVFYHLRSGNSFFTSREERDYVTLYGAIHYLTVVHETESFPKHVGRQCEYCDFLAPCREDRDFVLVPAESAEIGLDSVQPPLLVPSPVQKSAVTQRRLRFPKPKAVRLAPKESRPPETPRTPSRIIVRNLPWDEKPPQGEMEKHVKPAS